METPDKLGSAATLDTTTLNEVQLLLAEKRTSLSAMRTGIAVFAFPLSVLSVLIATSKSYEIHEVLHWLVPLVLLNLGLIALGIYLVTRAVVRIHHYDRLLDKLKSKNPRLAELLD
jgi:uncharacterized membrane protein YidH (DUF202 family)